MHSIHSNVHIYNDLHEYDKGKKQHNNLHTCCLETYSLSQLLYHYIHIYGSCCLFEYSCSSLHTEISFTELHRLFSICHFCTFGARFKHKTI